ncbi:MAG: hypothetical protein J0I19_15880 [Alphaproteobacteria bacterium]|nr:hypothetical protein [Alphaproteobacteria bacterium]
MRKLWLYAGAICLASVPAVAADDAAFGTRLDTMELELQLIDKKLDSLNEKMGDIAKDMAQLKNCAALAREKPWSSDNFRELKQHGISDAQARVLRTNEAMARMNCGLPVDPN